MYDFIFVILNFKINVNGCQVAFAHITINRLKIYSYIRVIILSIDVYNNDFEILFKKYKSFKLFHIAFKI